MKCLGCNTHQTVAPRYRAAAEDNSYPRTGALYEVQGLLAAAGATVRRSAADEHFGRRASVNMVAGGAMNIVKAVALLIAVPVLALPALAQQVQLQSAMEIDCSAYERNADGSWAVLRVNKILQRGKVWREVAPGDDLAKLRDGPFLNTCTALRLTKPPSRRCSASSIGTSATLRQCPACFRIIRLQ